MTQLLHLPVTLNNQFVVVDEDANVNYAENLIIAWLCAIRQKSDVPPIKILLFAYSKNCFQKHLRNLNLKNVEVQDYFSICLQNDEINELSKTGILYKQLTNFINESNSILVIDCLTTLILCIGITKTCKFIEKLSQNHQQTVFCIYRRDFCQNIPRIETLGTIYIKLSKSKKTSNNISNPNSRKLNIHYEANITQKKEGGSIIRWKELVQQSIEDFTLESEKISNNVNAKLEIGKTKETKIKPQSSFRLEMSEHEMKQRDSVPLPYILPGNPGGGSNIIYVPDNVDDLDEEDPDDDLDI